MAGEWLSEKFSLSSQVWFRWTGKCSETATSHMQTVGVPEYSEANNLQKCIQVTTFKDVSN